MENLEVSLKRAGHIVCVSLSLMACLAQKSSEPLSPETAAGLRKQTDAFSKVASEAAPAIKSKLSRQEARLVKILDQISDAEGKHDTQRASKLADELGSIDADVSRLHSAQADLRQMQSVNQLVTAGLSSSDPTGEVCNKGKCADVPPIVAILSLVTAGLVDELNKKEPFGPNNDIMKALHSIGGFVQCIFGCK